MKVSESVKHKANYVMTCLNSLMTKINKILSTTKVKIWRKKSKLKLSEAEKKSKKYFFFVLSFYSIFYFEKTN